jgi:hypothetical protein
MTNGMVLLLVILAVALVPIFTIWSLNAVFTLTIPVTLKTWLSALWLCLVFAGIRHSSNGK